jgi:DNA invertase Pin-like site-specific DNA recombinase
MIVGYARTSTTDQAAGLEAQERDLREAGAERVYSEQVSSIWTQRPALAEALDFLRKGDALTVAKPDRLARSIADLPAIDRDLSACGIDLIILSMGSERLDTRNPTSKLMLTILAAVATWEREIMLERQREGIAKAKGERKYRGRSHLFGGTEPRRMAAMALAGSATGLGRVFIKHLSGLASSQLPAVARLLTDLAIAVVELDVSPDGPARARPCAVADKLFSEVGGDDGGLVTDDDPIWRGIVVSTASTATQSPSIAGALPPSDGFPFTLDLPVSKAAWAKSELTEARAPTARRLLRACDRQSGIAFRRYVKFLVSHHRKLSGMVGTFETDFRMAVGKIDRELAKSRLLAGFARL